MRVMETAAVVSIFVASISPAADFLPLREGNQWTYTMSNGMQMTTRIVGFENVGAVRCAVAETEPGPPADAPAADQPTLERYQSADGRVVLHKPGDWQVTEGDMFGQGTYAVVVMEPQENAVVLFMTFPVGQEIKDSVVLAAKCVEALREEFPDLQATDMNSTPDRGRTMAELTLTSEGEKGAGHGYFFHTQNIGTVYLLLAKAQMWNELRPTLTSITANLAFAPQGVAAVQEPGRQLAEQAPVADGTSLSPAALVKQASQRPGRQLPLQPAALPDQSMSIQVPQGWSLEGQKAQFILVNNAQTRTLGQGSWVAENEDARVYHTDSWGIEGPEGRIDSPAYNNTNFTGQNPWGGGDLELIDTRAEYERYIANQ